MSDAVAQQSQLKFSEVLKKGDKITVLKVGSMMFTSAYKLVVREIDFPLASGGKVTAVAEPRKKKMTALESLCGDHGGALVLRGHDLKVCDEYAARLPSNGSGFTTRIMTTDSALRVTVQDRALTDDMSDVVDYINQHLVACNLTYPVKFVDKTVDPSTRGEDKARIIATAGANLPFHSIAGTPKPRKTYFPNPFTPAQIADLKERNKAEDVFTQAPYCKLFRPGTACTWLVYSMEDDNDTLWVVADIGMDCVEAGTLSLKEAREEVPGTMAMAPEVDRHFDPSKLAYTFLELCGMDRLPSDLHVKA